MWRSLLDGRILHVREAGAASDQPVEPDAIEVTPFRLEGLRGPLADSGSSALRIESRLGAGTTATLLLPMRQGPPSTAAV